VPLLSYAIPTKTGFGSEKATIHRHNRMRGAVGTGVEVTNWYRAGSPSLT
jgi:hypothetical protein